MNTWEKSLVMLTQSMVWVQQFMDSGLIPFMTCFQKHTFRLHPRSCSKQPGPTLYEIQVITGLPAVPKVSLPKARDH